MIECVRNADEIVARINNRKPTDDELIEDRKTEDKYQDDDDEYRPILHTLDGHSSGTFMYTGIGFGLNPQETTLVRFTERRNDPRTCRRYDNPRPKA